MNEVVLTLLHTINALKIIDLYLIISLLWSYNNISITNFYHNYASTKLMKKESSVRNVIMVELV